MIHVKIDLTKEYQSITAGTLTGYVREVLFSTSRLKKRPTIIIVAGGAYLQVSDRAQEPLAMKFLGAGFNVFTLDYSVAPARYPNQVNQLACAVHYIKKNCEKFNVDEDKIAILGCSAGGHLCASFSCTSSQLEENLSFENGSLNIAACCLCYPVISFGEFSHKESFDNLTGGNDVLSASLSAENLVSKKTPPTFVWTTATDELVMAENSMLYAMSLSKHKVPYELHVFDSGMHGLSTCEYDVSYDNTNLISKTASKWLPLCETFLKKYLDFDFLQGDFKF